MGTILGPTLGPDRPKRGQDEPKRAIRSFKEPKSCIFKNLKKPTVFDGFWVQRPPKRASRNPKISQEEPKENQNHQQKDQKLNPKNYIFFIKFGLIIEIKNAQKIIQKKPIFFKQTKKAHFLQNEIYSR